MSRPYADTDTDDDPGFAVERSLLCYQTQADVAACVLHRVTLTPAEDEETPSLPWERED